MGAELKEKAKKAAKVAGLGVGLAAGVAAGGMEISKGMEQLAERDRAHETLNELAMTTPFERAQEAGLSLDLPEMTPEREEAIAAIDGGYTDLAASEGHLSTFAKTCGYELEDGTVMLDALKCNDFYADQFRPDDNGIKAIAEAHGYTPEEVLTHGAIMRKSLVSHGTVIGVPGFESLVAVGYYDDQRIPGTWRASKKELYDGYYEDASALTFALIKDLDLIHAEPEKQRAAELAIADVIKANVVRENRTLLVENDITHLMEEASRTALIGGYTDVDSGEFRKPHIAELEDAEKAAATAWTRVTSFEQRTGGPAHVLAHAHLEAHGTIVRDILKSGKAAGLETDFFTAQLETRSNLDGAADLSD